MSDIGYEGKNEFEMIKVELGDDKEYVKRYDVAVFPDFGVFVNGEYFRFYGQKLAGYTLPICVSCSDILQFAANRTSDGILRISHSGMIPFLEQNSNVVYLGLFDEGVSAFHVPDG